MASRGRSSGYRRGADFRETSARVELAGSLAGLELAVGVSLADGSWRQPGALTEQEMKEDPWQSGSNELDFSETSQYLAALRANDAPGGRHDWAGSLSFRAREGRVLTTGRDAFSAPSCDGFVTDEAMTYKASENRYQLFIEIEDDLDGLEVSVSDEGGECDDSPIH